MRFTYRKQVFEFYRTKRTFSGFSNEVLWDDVDASTQAVEGGELELAYGREWEAAAYRSTPFLWGMIRKKKLPVLGLRGKTSDNRTAEAFRRWRRLQPHADLRECTGGHLLPFEYPLETAAHVIEFLSGQEG